MKNNNIIKVFEHELLLIGNNFQKHHWRDLALFNEKHDGKYCTLLQDGVKFNQYVGVIQIGELSIEILPKIGRTSDTEAEKSKWQSVLLDMLNECSWLKLNVTENTSLKIKPNSILEAYIAIFISECEVLLREGLIKKYRTIEENSYALKGKLLLNLHISKNFIHKERFYTAHPTYDRNNTINQVIYKALNVVKNISKSPSLNDKINELLFSFPEVDDINVTTSTFERIIYDRKSERYRQALQIAFMLLLNYRPDVASGDRNVLAILFDMNDLWEEYISVQLRKFIKPEWVLSEQKQRKFWSLNNTDTYKIIKPDLVVTNQENKSIIIDTKWKLPDGNVPSDADLKQMYVYNHYWNGINSILLYPKQKYEPEIALIEGSYKIPSDHKCSIAKVSVLNKENQGLDPKLGNRIIKMIEKEFSKLSTIN